MRIIERVTVRPSRDAAIALLSRAGLPTSDITQDLLENFFFAGNQNEPLGVVGLEISAPHALLRSLVVAGADRRSGLGSRLLEHAEKHARSRGVRRIYLLTTTAEAFFARRGYAVADRGNAPPFIRSSAEFVSLCPANAAFMVKYLQEL